MKTLNKIRDKLLNQVDEGVSQRYKLILFATFSFWLKAIITYFTKFQLGIDTPLQVLLAVINPIGATLLLLCLPFFIRKEKKFVVVFNLLNIVNTLWLFSNVVYFREFSDFIAVDTLLKVGSVSEGLFNSAWNMVSASDLLYWVDTFAIIFYTSKKYRGYNTNKTHLHGVFLSAISVCLLVGNLSLAEIDRPQLLTRSFDNKYIVKYLGMVPYFAHNGFNSYQVGMVKAKADESSLTPVLDYLQHRKTTPNDNYEGIAKGRNVMFIHLESIQQFLMDYRLESGEESHEVLPFLNSLYHSPDSIAFDNIFHQTKGGKTADAEYLVENSLFGVNEGAAMVKYGNNQYYAGPAIFKNKGYSTSVFHGNNSSFWNRNNIYKNWGYDKFIYLDYFGNREPENMAAYGLMDRPFFQQSIPYLKNARGPFYAKFIPVTHHFPYDTENIDTEFPIAETEDETINNYFATANYFDDVLREFFDKLKEDGTYDNTIFVLYGDHYGISNSRNKTLAELLPGQSPDDWDGYDNIMMQRIPLIFHIPGADLQQEEIVHTFGGQVDILPTLLNLMGDTDRHIHMGQDLLSEDHQNSVVLRNGTVINPINTINGSRVYDTNTGERVEVSEEIKSVIDEQVRLGKQQLEMSDKVVEGDLLRFFYSSLPKLNTESINYLPQIEVN